MGLTARDLAEICQVNVSTVSRALRDDPRITPATRERIQRAAREHGYSPNQSARNLAAGKTNSIWFFLGSLDNEIEQKPAVHMSQMLRDAGYDLLLVLHNNKMEIFKRLLRKLSQQVADAAIIIPPTFDNQLMASFMPPPDRLPIIFLDRWVENTGRPVVTTDNVFGSSSLAELCHQAGAEFFAVLFESGNPVSRTRKEAACDYFVRHGLPYGTDPEALHRYLRNNPGRPVAILGNSGGGTCADLRQLPAELVDNRTFVGGFFDNWIYPDKSLFSRIFICRQDFRGLAARCTEITLDWLKKGKAPGETIVTVRPEAIREI